MERHRCFRAVLHALSQPGRPQSSPVAAPATPALVLRAIWEPDQMGESVFVVRGEPEPGALERLPRGHEEEPQLGCTVLLVAAPEGPRTPVWLEGPGLRERERALLPLSASALASRARACADPPAGIDLVLVTPDGSILGLPRTTRVSLA